MHPCHDRRFAVDGWMEGVLWYPKKAVRPGAARSGSLRRHAAQETRQPARAGRAIVSTHIAMSVLRMEPLWMTTGQIAGLAAAVAKDKSLDVANLAPESLPQMLKIKTDPYA